MYYSLINAIPFPRWIDETAIPITDNFGIKWYGLSFVIGIGLAYFYTKWAVRQKSWWTPTGVTKGVERVPNKALLEDFVFFCMLGIFVGGRIGSILLYNTSQYIEDPLSVFRVWEGGMSFHGGFIGVCLAVWYTAKKYKIGLWRIADAAAIGAPLGIFCVRMANFVNQELYGRPTDVPWAFIFETDPISTPRHPSQLYEAFLEGILIFALIYVACRLYHILSRPGLAAGLFIVLYGIFRTSVEFFREPDPIPQISEYFTRGMLYSTPMILIGGLIIYWALKRPPSAPRFMPEPDKSK